MAQTPSPSERRAALEARFPTWEPRPMHEWLARVTEEFGDREFIVTDERTFTYRQMLQWSRDVAAGLATRGIGKGDHVAVVIGNYPEYVAVKFGISALGAVIVPVNTMYLRDELAFVLRDSRAKALITMTAFRTQDYLGMLDEIAPGWDADGAGDALPDLRFIAQFEAMAPARPGVPTIADVARWGRTAAVPPVQMSAADVSVIFYTSGTTGSPKGVLWSHDAEARVGYGGRCRGHSATVGVCRRRCRCSTRSPTTKVCTRRCSPVAPSFRDRASKSRTSCRRSCGTGPPRW